MSEGKILFAEKDGVFALKFSGDIRLQFSSAINAVLERICSCKQFGAVIIDLTETTGIDSTALGLLAKVSLKTQEHFGYIPTIVSSSEDVNRILSSMGFESVFHIIQESPEYAGELTEMQLEKFSEPDLRQQVIEAHKVLMELNDSNKEMFQDLMEALRQEEKQRDLHHGDGRQTGTG